MSDYFLYVKTTNKCQLKCSHCYVDSTINNDEYLNIDYAINWVNGFCEEHKDDNIIASLHGGEPMLSNIDDNIRLVKETKKNKNIFWSATTNLIYNIDDKKIDLFNEFVQKDGKKILLTSYDIKIRFNQAQEELWKENVRKLITLGVDVKPIVCLTSFITLKNIEQVFNLFIDLGICSMNFERITETGRAIRNPLRPSNNDLDLLLYDIYELWNRKYRKKLSISLFEDIEMAFNTGYLVGCRARECSSKVRTMNSDGTICSCPNKPENIIRDKNDENKYHSEELKKNNKCYSCKYFKYCNGDCYQLVWDGDVCPAPKKIYEYLYNKKEG